MRSFQLLSLVSILLLLHSPAQAQHPHRPSARHRQHINPLDSTFDQKHKRDANVAFTYFNDGRGACGITNGPNDFIVALNSAEYDGGAHCFEMITITVNGKTAQAQIVDECSGCSMGGLDFSQSLFEYFGSLSQGELQGSWSYNSDIPASSSATPSPTTSSVSTPTPTTTTSSSTASSATIMTSSMSTVVPSSTSTTFTVPTSTPQDPEIVTQINLALLELGSLLRASLPL